MPAGGCPVPRQGHRRETFGASRVLSSSREGLGTEPGIASPPTRPCFSPCFSPFNGCHGVSEPRGQLCHPGHPIPAAGRTCRGPADAGRQRCWPREPRHLRPPAPPQAGAINESQLGQGARRMASRFKGPTAKAWGGFGVGIPRGGVGGSGGSLWDPPDPSPSWSLARDRQMEPYIGRHVGKQPGRESNGAVG